MRKTKHTKLNKMLMIIAALMMVLLLSGCRTRISNNTEVASTITDDDGWLQETYDMRRDELGIPIAKKPFIKGSTQEDIDDYDEELDRDEEDEDYEEDFEEEEVDDDDDEVDNSSSSSSSQTVTTRPSTRTRTNTSTVRRRTTNTTKKKTSTKKSNTETNTANTENNTDQNTEQQKKQFTVSFDGNGVDMEGVTISVEEGGTYTELPTPPARDDYTFDGWFTEAEGGTQVTEGSSYTSDSDQTLYAHWTRKDPSEIWSNRFDVAANDQTEKLDCLLQGNVVKAMEKAVDDCKGNLVNADTETSPKCIIIFAPNEDITDEGANTIFDENAAENPVLEKVIVISDDSIYGSDRQKLFYKLVLLDAMHESIGQETLDEAASELGISEYWIAVYKRPLP